MNLFKSAKLFISCAIIGIKMTAWSGVAHADNLEATPTSWCLQDYNDGGITLFFTGSSCYQGQLILPSTANNDSKQRLWSIVVTGKAAARPVGIYYHYDSSAGACLIDSFYLS